MLVVATCSMNLEGEYVAPGLADSQTLPRLYGFGHRLAEVHARIRARRAPKLQVPQ